MEYTRVLLFRTFHFIAHIIMSLHLVCLYFQSLQVSGFVEVRIYVAQYSLIQVGEFRNLQICLQGKYKPPGLVSQAQSPRLTMKRKVWNKGTRNVNYQHTLTSPADELTIPGVVPSRWRKIPQHEGRPGPLHRLDEIQKKLFFKMQSFLMPPSKSIVLPLVFNVFAMQNPWFSHWF